MFCSNCGNNLPDDSKFCDGCGTKLQQDIAPVYPPKPVSSEASNQNPNVNQPPAFNQAKPNINTPPVPPPVPPPNAPPVASSNAPQNTGGGYQPTSFVSTNTRNSVDTPDVLSVGNFLLMMFLSLIPVVGFILLIVWAFSNDSNKNKKNWAIATLLFWLIGAVVSTLLTIVIFVFIGSALGGFMGF